MEPGQFVVQCRPMMNRDPRQFENPDVFIPDRAPNRHVALGLGIHRCLGAHLLKIEARVAAEEFLRRIPEFEPDPAGETELAAGPGRRHGAGPDRVPARRRVRDPEGSQRRTRRLRAAG